MFFDFLPSLFPSEYSYQRLPSSPQPPAKMGKQLGTFRAVYLVAICCMG